MLIPSFQELRQFCPVIADRVLDEFYKNSGFIPYDQGYVYCLHAVGSDYYKFGKTKNPDRRALEISPKMPFETKFFRVWRSNFMGVAERMVHEHLQEYRVNGEWFELKPIEEANGYDGCIAGINCDGRFFDAQIMHAYTWKIFDWNMPNPNQSGWLDLVALKIGGTSSSAISRSPDFAMLMIHTWFEQIAGSETGTFFTHRLKDFTP